MKRFKSHIPNAITLLNLLTGCMAVVFAAQGGPGYAAVFILVAAVFDFLDGMAARLLNVRSPIGQQLDSLADMISFGFAPAFILHIHVTGLYTDPVLPYVQPGLTYMEFAGFYLPFVIVIFAALRLARFNIDDRQEESFLGLPTPAMALLVAAGVYVYHHTGILKEVPLLVQPWFWEVAALVLSVLMILPIRMFSMKFKDLSWSNNQIRYIFVGISLFLLVSLQALAFPLIIIWYILLSLFYHIFEIKQSKL